MSLRRPRGAAAAPAQSPGEAAAAAAANIPAKAAAPMVPSASAPPTIPGGLVHAPAGAPAVPQKAPSLAGLSQTAPTLGGQVDPNPFASLVPSGAPAAAAGPSLTAPGPIETAVASAHQLGVAGTPTSSVVEKSIVDLMGTVARLERKFDTLAEEFRAVVSSVKSIESRAGENAQLVASSMATLQLEFTQTLQHQLELFVGQLGARAATTANPSPQQAVEVAQPGAIAAPGANSQLPARQQQIGQALSTMVAEHYSNPSAIQINANDPTHRAFLVKAVAYAGIAFQSSAADPSLDQNCIDEVLNSATACGMLGADGIVRPRT